MPRAARQHSLSRPGSRQPVAVAAPRTMLVLRWSVSREAAAAAGLIAPEAEESPALELIVPWDGPVHGIWAALINGAGREELALEGAATGAWVMDAGTDLRHLDLPGLVRISARPKAGGLDVLYARTDVLGRLGLAGGRYDFERGELVTEPR